MKQQDQTDEANAVLIHCLKHNDIFSQTSALALAKIFPYIVIKDLKQGDTLLKLAKPPPIPYICLKVAV